jgi:hypothetical protein
MSFLATILLALAIFSHDNPDLVVFKKGKEVECRVLFEDDAKVIYTTGRKPREVARDEVAEVHSIERSVRTFLERFASLDSSNVTALAELALWAESNNLPGEARNLWIRILILDNENEQAWTKLGGSKGRKEWRIRVRGRYKTLEQLRERASEWKTALELPTAHYLIKTNVDPMLALDVAIDLERVNQMYYDTIGQVMELFPFEEVPEMHIYAATDDAPRPPQPSWTAWYERIGNTVMVRGLEANRHEIRKSVVDQLIRNSFRLAQGNREGSIPNWAREGISNAFAFALRADPGDIGIQTGVPYMPWFVDQAADPKPKSLKRILDGGRGAFKTGDAEQQFVRESYTLAFFLVNGDDGIYRERFIEFLRSAFDGQGAATHFQKIFGESLEDIEAAWMAYVAKVAGA